MARFAVVAASALLAVLLVVAAEASIYRTVVTTEVSQGGRMPEQCQQEMMQADMRHCEDYIRQASQQYMLKSMVNQRQQVPQMCCSQLRQMRKECRCPAVMQAAMQAMGGYGQEERYMEGAYRAASQMTGMCGVEPRHCDVPQEGY
ncbi:hypothetical protein Sjap_025300 [Stephania japonica]|uniref:Bifunctional inhibitor/plant lipid transfer protein/seed storage helical domain-containing protein n=1 Tax=Stephania japonica TaxID=461633 RepID=A0AAP0E1F6_9MAGN